MATLHTVLVASRETAAPANVTTGVASDVTGNTFPNDGNTYILGRNATGGALTIEVVPASGADTVDGATIPNRVLTVAAATSKLFGPFPVELYGAVVSFTSANAAFQVNIFRPDLSY